MRTALAAFALALATAAPASAAQVAVTFADGCRGDSACTKYGGLPPVPVIGFTDPAGEPNRLSVAAAGAALTFTDAAAPLQAGTGCTAIDERTARCPLRTSQTYGIGFPQAAVSLGAGDDVLVVDPAVASELSVDGGAGVDDITGGAGPDTVAGGPGDDRLRGGGGFDTLDFAARTSAVTVAMAAGTAGQAGERDTFASFEIVEGGRGRDVLTGGAGPDVLRGNDGDDRIVGAGGDDELVGGTGNDDLSGGAGGDIIQLDPEQGDGVYTTEFPPGNDTGDGGAGNDSIVDAAGGRNVFIGGAGNDALTGSVGADRLSGGAGDDALDGEAGIDRYDGGSGRDRVIARDGLAETVLCGTGRDRGRFDRRDRLTACEFRLR